MVKKIAPWQSAIGLLLGVVGGVAGTAFSMGGEFQHTKDAILDLQLKQQEIRDLNQSISDLVDAISDLRTDVRVLQALVERIEDKSPTSQE